MKSLFINNYREIVSLHSTKNIRSSLIDVANNNNNNNNNNNYNNHISQ